MTLDQLHNGQAATIVDCEGDDEVALRLMELGLVPGERISRIGSAPLGDPIEYHLRSTRISLRRSEARRISVEP